MGIIDSKLSRWFTVEEILQQPKVWRACAPTLAARAKDIQSWLDKRGHDEVWFCGAGTSAYIGETLAAYLNRVPGKARFRAIPSTDFVSSPMAFIRDRVRVLAVSFGRSGNSSESVAMLKVLDQFAPHFDLLNITCNADSALARHDKKGSGELRSLALPPETNDRGFAMTSSYSTMLLSALACFDRMPPGNIETLMAQLADAGQGLVDEYFGKLTNLATPQRAVFLGSGALTGAARESALKVLELSAGQISTSWDSSLGFRHGPKAVVNTQTRIFVFGSADPYTQRYDNDLAQEIEEQFGGGTAILVGPTEGSDICIATVGNDAWSAVLYVAVAQMIAVGWSEQLGLAVDDPFAGRNLTRVVTGVRVYEVPPTRAPLVGALDVGGTKIEATLFDENLNVVETSRAATNKESYPALLDSIIERAEWLRSKGGSDIRIGMGLPGLASHGSGVATTSNLPATGHNLAADLSSRLGIGIPIENDCKCFALSEANGGAGQGFRTVFGLIIGTGLGGGVCVDGELQTAHNGLPGEVGHFGIPASLAAKHGLPILQCGCGRSGCYETLVSGTGMSRIAEYVTGKPATAEAVAAAAKADPAMAKIFDIWLDLLCELLHTVQLTVDPDCVVIGGGVSRIDGLIAMLTGAYESHRLPGVRSPQFRIAQHGDASGARGAALLARKG